MFDKSQVSCNCFGVSIPPQQKFFLARKRQPEETESPQSVRRVVKSSQIKNQVDGKGQKKSLKKRPGSFVHSDNNHPGSSEQNKVEGELKNIVLHDLPVRNKNVGNKGADSPVLSHSNAYILKFPQTTTTSRQPTFAINPKQYVPNKIGDFDYIRHDPPFFTPLRDQSNNEKLRPQLLEFHNQTSNHIPPLVINQKEADRDKQIGSKPFVSTHLIPNQQFLTQSNPFYSEKSIRLQTENWTPPSQDPLLIQDFQKLFKNKEDYGYHKHANKQKTTLKPREAQKSKRFQQQQLMGRFAQSEDEDCSQAPHSQVIGRGFDSTYQDLLEHNEALTIQQTKASRSTNTKVSNLRGQKPVFQEHQRTKFGNLTHFTSYDRL